MLGSILELVHGSWRLLVLYFSGVILGGLFAMALSPGTFLVGASGGDYALIFAFLANVIINWNSMTGDLSSKIRWFRLTFVVVWLSFDIGTLIYRFLTYKVSHISWQAHLGGGLAGITLGKRNSVKNNNQTFIFRITNIVESKTIGLGNQTQMDRTCTVHHHHDFGDIINYFPPEAKIISHVRPTLFPLSCLQADGCVI